MSVESDRIPAVIFSVGTNKYEALLFNAGAYSPVLSTTATVLRSPSFIMARNIGNNTNAAIRNGINIVITINDRFFTRTENSRRATNQIFPFISFLLFADRRPQRRQPSVKIYRSLWAIARQTNGRLPLGLILPAIRRWMPIHFFATNSATSRPFFPPTENGRFSRCPAMASIRRQPLRKGPCGIAPSQPPLRRRERHASD